VAVWAPHLTAHLMWALSDPYSRSRQGWFMGLAFSEIREISSDSNPSHIGRDACRSRGAEGV
jgi:hypothetical protein